MRSGIYLTLLCVAAAASMPMPNPFFLTEAEIEDARGNSSLSRHDSGISLYSSNNTVTPLIDGRNFFQQLMKDLNMAAKGDYIHATFFEGDSGMTLDVANKTTTLVNVLKDAYSRGVNIRILANLNLYLPTNALSLCHSLNTNCGNCCVPETHHGHWSGALHAKCWIIQRQGEVVAYVGGLDVQAGRYDTQLHNNDEDRRKAPQDFQPFWGWHDMMNYVQGPAVVDIARQFYLQWNDPIKDSGSPYTRKPFDWTQPAFSTNLGGSLDIQFLRTLGCYGAKKDGYYQNNAPLGEITGMNAFLKMIRSAKKYIYLADQFAFFNEALDEATKVLDTIEALVILTDDAISFQVKTPLFNITTAQDMRYYFQRKAFEKLMSKPEWAAKVHVFSLQRPGSANGDGLKNEDIIYVHTKNYIIDDEFMITGSMGLERTGFTNDIEMAIGIHDVQGDYVKQVRKRLWAEHLMVQESDPLLEDPIVAVKEWVRQADTMDKRLRHYFPKEVKLTSSMALIYEIYEPEGRCDRIATDDAVEERVEDM